MPVWGSVLITALGILNAWLLLLVNRANKRNDEHLKEHETLKDRMLKYETSQLSESRFREIIREELRGFELNLINNNQISPRTRRP